MAHHEHHHESLTWIKARPHGAPNPARMASSFPIVAIFRGLPASAALQTLLGWHAHQLPESVPGLDVLQLQATVERREWPAHPPTVQVSLELSLPNGVLAARAGDYGRSNAYMAMDAAFAELRARVARLPIDPGQRLALGTRRA